MTTLNFPHQDDNHWLTIEVGGVEHPQYPSPLEVKMLIEEAVNQERARIKSRIVSVIGYDENYAKHLLDGLKTKN